MTQDTAIAAAQSDRPIVYVPFGEKNEIKLTIATVKNHVATPTKSGKLPSNSDIIKFMMLCKSRELNPWAGDAYLIGYDSRDGPTFTLITAHQALLKRAEACGSFDGMESGVIFADKDGKIDHREGDILYDGDKLIGGWCSVYRRDRSKRFYSAINLKVFDTGRSRWGKDPAGMISKCAQAASLRKAFPTQLGGLHNAEEMEHAQVTANVVGTLVDSVPSTLDDLAEKMVSPRRLVSGDEVAGGMSLGDLQDIKFTIDGATELDVLRGIYDQHVGPDSTLSGADITTVGDWVERRRREIEMDTEAKAPEGELFEKSEEAAAAADV